MNGVKQGNDGVTLRKCPFCGGEAKLEKGLCELDNYVMCLNCRCKTKLHNTKESAVKAWNRRAPLDHIIENIEEYIEEAEHYGFSSAIVDIIAMIKEEVG